MPVGRPAARPPAVGGTPADPGPAAADPAAPDASASEQAPPPAVTAVLVAHDGARWLPAALTALREQTVHPARVVAVDTGSTDGSGAVLREALGEDAVLDLPAGTGYPAAVAAALERVPSDPWVWLLHDDAAPDPDCLQRLLDEAARQPSAGLLGPKAVDWDDDRVLVEVGLTTDRAGARVTGLETRELDQGQLDAVRDVLAVGTAGALVRRDRWDAVGGLDPALPLFRDDLDLGWRITAAGARVLVVPPARVRHARAATTGRRALDAVRGPAPRVDRRHALFVLLAHASAPRLLLAVPALVLGTLLRALLLLVVRRPADAADELAAAVAVLGHPGALLRARRRRSAARTVPRSVPRGLLAPRTAALRGRVEGLGAALVALPDRGRHGGHDRRRRHGPLRALLSAPPVLLVLALALLALVAERSVLVVHGGVLAGGRLLPSPRGASDLWSAWISSWSSAGVGTGATPPPSVAVLAGLSTLLLGRPGAAVDLVLLAAVPLSGATAYLAARRVVAHPGLRLWAAATWALLPVATGAVAGGRLDAAALQVLLPLVALALGPVLRRDLHGRWHLVWRAGLVLALACAVAPALLLVAVPVLLVAAVAVAVRAPTAQRPGAVRRAAALVLVAVLPVLLLLPWSAGALRSPDRLLAGSGPLVASPDLTDPSLPAWHLPLLHAGGAGLPPVWVTVGVLLAALGGLARRGRSGSRAGIGWLVALAGLGAALVLARSTVSAAGGEVPAWPGVPLQVAGLALLLAVLAAADGLPAALSRLDFGWRHAVTAAVTVAAVATPVLAGATWAVRGVDGPLHRSTPAALPAFVLADLQSEPGLRALVLSRRPDGTVRYDVVTGEGETLGRGDRPAAAEQARRLDGVVADLLSPRGTVAADALATRAVRYVLLSGQGAASAAAALDAQDGLVRRSDDPVLLWQVTSPTARLTVLPRALAAAARSGADGPPPALLRAAPPQRVPAGSGTAEGTITTTLPPGSGGRLLVLAEAADPGWRATLAGRPLRRTTAWGWAQAFELPDGVGRLVVHHDDGGRPTALLLEGIAVLAVAVLSLPAGRRRTSLEAPSRRRRDGVRP